MPAPLFVIQEPTMEHGVRRLAIEGEDHPLEYAKFHGSSPKRKYGVRCKRRFFTDISFQIAAPIERGGTQKSCCRSKGFCLTVVRRGTKLLDAGKNFKVRSTHDFKAAFSSVFIFQESTGFLSPSGCVRRTRRLRHESHSNRTERSGRFLV